MRLTWHSYNYYPYERDLAAREVAALLGRGRHRVGDEGVEVQDVVNSGPATRLTYFSGLINGQRFIPTVQEQLEEAARNGAKKQATRYSVHGLHEYKGKFNPQVVRALLNIFGIEPEQRVMDPFCGSGTALVECAHLGAVGVGTDINPFAVKVACAKLKMLRTPAAQLKRIHKRLCGRLRDVPNVEDRDDARRAYLASWFDPDVLKRIETLRFAIEDVAGDWSEVFLIGASNLLRVYSRQDPNDLRTRRRRSPLPKVPFEVAYLERLSSIIARVEAAQVILGTEFPRGEIRLRDVRDITPKDVGGKVDAAITSPPYAMALPYIDTQRLSLVWLGLCGPKAIRRLEAELIGSREFRGAQRRALLARMLGNASDLPEPQYRLCVDLHRALDKEDGFRRQAVPLLLYRYFTCMKNSFGAVRRVMRRSARYALIVGHNHTVIGGRRREIDTPWHLARLAATEGWAVDELIPLQTYQRYGYHVSNAVAAETLIVLHNP